MRDVRRAKVAVWLGLAMLAAAAGCSSQVEDTGRGLCALLEGGDHGRRRRAVRRLDQTTRWDWMTVQKWHREAYDIVISNYPQGPERERELHRFEKGATASSARELFKARWRRRCCRSWRSWWCRASRDRDPAARRHRRGGAARRRAGALRARRERRLGICRLPPDAEARKNRAYHDLEQVRANAADYERAAARGPADGGSEPRKSAQTETRRRCSFRSKSRLAPGLNRPDRSRRPPRCPSRCPPHDSRASGAAACRRPAALAAVPRAAPRRASSRCRS